MNEHVVTAYGTGAAIAQAFGGKGVRALQAFRQGLEGGGGPAGGDSKQMGDLRQRINQVLNVGRGKQ